MNKDQIDIISYKTFKKRYKPTIYECRDGTKGWIRETRIPTLIGNGWHFCIQEYDYSLFDKEKPKDMAKRLILEVYGLEWTRDKKFVYFNSRNYQYGFEDCLLVYWKPAND